MNLRTLPILLASIALVHCQMPQLGNETSWNENGTQSASLDVTLSLPTDTTGHTATTVVGNPMVVDVYLQQVGPGTCTNGLLGRSCSDHSYSDVTSFDLSDVGCDDDLCDVVSISRNTGRADASITIIPKSTSIILRAGAASGSLSGSSELWIVPAPATGIKETRAH
jgi:hypothetical protein